MDERTTLEYCCPSTVPSLWPPPPSQCTVYADSVWLWGWGDVEMYCGPYSAGVLHSVADQIQNLQNCFTTPNKMTSKDDIKGLVSLKFLRPWPRLSLTVQSLYIYAPCHLRIIQSFLLLFICPLSAQACTNVPSRPASYIGWRAGTTTLYRRRLYPPVRD
jgi:hypothetical protein